MNRYISFLVILFSFLITMQLFSQTPVAPWAPLKPDAPKDWGTRNYTVPTQQEIGIPIYPNTYLTTISTASVDSLKPQESEILPFVILVSSDPPEKIIAFYKDTLKSEYGWNYTEEYTTFIKSNPMIKVLTGKYPSVAVRDENGDEFDLVFVDKKFKENLKTRIRITYKPNK